MTYRERLTTPVSWWIIALVVGLTFVTAVGFYLGPWVSVAAGVATAGVIAGQLGWLGRRTVQVEEGGVRVDRSLLDWHHVGRVQPLDAAQTRARMGTDADARAWVVQRPWLTEAVEIQVSDAADPHPYWLISSREPVLLAAAIEQARPAETPR